MGSFKAHLKIKIIINATNLISGNIAALAPNFWESSEKNAQPRKYRKCHWDAHQRAMCTCTI